MRKYSVAPGDTGIQNSVPDLENEEREKNKRWGPPGRKHNERGDTGGEGTLTQWVHCEFVVSSEAIRPVITQQVCGEFF